MRTLNDPSNLSSSVMYVSARLFSALTCSGTGPVEGSFAMSTLRRPLNVFMHVKKTGGGGRSKECTCGATNVTWASMSLYRPEQHITRQVNDDNVKNVPVPCI